MKYVFPLLFFLSLMIPAAQAQENQPSENTVIEADGQYFMPYSKGIKEKSLIVNADVARMKPSQVSQLKRKLNSCSSLFFNDTLFNPLTGLKAVFKGEIYQIDGLNDWVKWIPSSFEIDLFSTLAKDSLPFWESEPDAWIAIHFNNPKKLVGNPVINDIYLEPVKTDSFSEWLEYDRISVPNRVEVAKKNNLHFFDPVSREDFILTLITFFQGSIDKAEKNSTGLAPQPSVKPSVSKMETERQKFADDLDKIRKYDPVLADRLMQAYSEAEKSSYGNSSDEVNVISVDNNIVLNTWREAVRKLKAEMNAMSPMERKSQAWWSNTEDSNVSGLTPAGFIGSRPLVRLNKNLMDKTKPTSTIQLIVTEWSMMPGSDFSDITGYDLSYDKISQIGNNERLWQQVYNLIDP
jgi:hypothetical protein